MRVEVYSDDGNLLFKVNRIGSKRRCDGERCDAEFPGRSRATHASVLQVHADAIQAQLRAH